MDEIGQSVRRFISENFVVGQNLAKLTDEASLLERGVIDSTGVLELLTFIEDTFGVQVADEEMIPENLDSIARIARFVIRKREAGAGG